MIGKDTTYLPYLLRHLTPGATGMVCQGIFHSCAESPFTVTVHHGRTYQASSHAI